MVMGKTYNANIIEIFSDYWIKINNEDLYDKPHNTEARF